MIDPGQVLTDLFAAARSAEACLVVALNRPLDELRIVARKLDRQLGELVRRRTDIDYVRGVIADEILRRAFRNDVFLNMAQRRKDGR